jgi:hypothetical protein
VSTATTIVETPQEQLSKLFGSYKAEWLQERMFDLYTEPSYYPELTDSRPCLLIGGRGTGKTTVLRSMSYEGRFALGARQVANVSSWDYYGFYYRTDTNRVTAFKGPEISEQRWAKIFAHYFNLVMCDLALRFLQWYHLILPGSQTLAAAQCSRIGESLHLTNCDGIAALASAVVDAQLKFEAYINNIADAPGDVRISMQGAPVDLLFAEVLKLKQFIGKNFFFLLDEYENFEDYQQKVVNTLLKHASQFYTFKIGVKELGWRCRTTLNENEQLNSPADYVRIRIQDKLENGRFGDFAFKVCGERIARLKIESGSVLDLPRLLPALSVDREAEVLDGAEGVAHQLAKAARAEIPDSDRARYDSLRLLEQYFLVFWAKAQGSSIADEWHQFQADEQKWRERYDNYKHALLYTLRRGKAGIRKYYSGWDTFVQVSGLNIRYILELVEQVLRNHLELGGALDEPVPPNVQTHAAIRVGRKNMAELEGLSVHGGQLTKLVLGLGRVFQVMAANLEGHTPEVNQFRLIEKSSADRKEPERVPSLSTDVQKLLNGAVMHLALLRFPGSKLSDEADTLEYDYMLHPIFSALFVISYRRKRKMTITDELLKGLVSDPKTSIRHLLASTNRGFDEPLPEQLSLFEAYYGAA